MSNNICRGENCSNLCVPGAYYCEEVHNELKLQSEDEKHVSVKHDWPPGVIFGRPYYMKVFFQKADKKAADALTGLPQLPDPSSDKAQMPQQYELEYQALKLREEKQDLGPDEKLDLRILEAIRKRYLMPKRDLDDLKMRQGSVNDHYRRRLGGRGRVN
jgi:hypothetical protein